MKEFKNLCKCKQAHEYAQIKCNQSSSWACSPYLCASLVQEFWSSSILQCCSLLIHVHACTLISLISLCPNISYLCPNFSPFVINDHKRPNTIWNLCHVKINGYHLKILLWKYLVAWCKKLDLGRWLNLESLFLMDTFNWLVLTPLVTTTCGSMKTTLKCHMYVTCRILDLDTL